MEILANKLGTTYEYLSKDVFIQIQENIKTLNKELKINNFDKYNYNLCIAVKYKIYDLVFYICNQIFKKFIFEKCFNSYVDEILGIIPSYFDSLLEIKDIESKIIYNLDLACYFFIKKEYETASYYFKFLRKMTQTFENLKPYEDLIFINEVNCYINLGQYYKIHDLKEKIDFKAENSIEDIYLNEFKYLQIVWNVKYDFSKLNKNVILKFLENVLCENRVEYLYRLCNILYELGYVDECIYFCRELYSVISEKNFGSLSELDCRSLIYISKIYLENSIFDKLEQIIDDSLNLSIRIGYTEFICEAYFNKAILCGKRNDFDKLDTYVNLCIYFLNQFKFSENTDKFLSIGFIFYKLGNIYEAVNNFKNVI